MSTTRRGSHDPEHRRLLGRLRRRRISSPRTATITPGDQEDPGEVLHKPGAAPSQAIPHQSPTRGAARIPASQEPHGQARQVILDVAGGEPLHRPPPSILRIAGGRAWGELLEFTRLGAAGRRCGTPRMSALAKPGGWQRPGSGPRRPRVERTSSWTSTSVSSRIRRARSARSPAARAGHDPWQNDRSCGTPTIVSTPRSTMTCKTALRWLRHRQGASR
jgi:hypothetical protein